METLEPYFKGKQMGAAEELDSYEDKATLSAAKPVLTFLRHQFATKASVVCTVVNEAEAGHYVALRVSPSEDVGLTPQYIVQVVRRAQELAAEIKAPLDIVVSVL